MDTDDTIFPALRTEHLVLREITSEDFDFWLRNFSDPTTVDLTSYPAPPDERVARLEIAKFCTEPFRRGDGIRWGIEPKGTTSLIGTLGFHGWEKDDRRARVGYDLLPSHRGRGIMSEALLLVIRYGYDAMNLNKIEAHADSRNVKSISLLVRMGFHMDGTLRDHTFFNGSFRDEVVYSLLRREWAPGKESTY